MQIKSVNSQCDGVSYVYQQLESSVHNPFQDNQMLNL